MEAARHWAIGGNDQNRGAALKDARDLLASLQAWNAGPEHTGPVEAEIERLTAATEFNVHQDNWSSVMLFCDLSTQWRYLPTMGAALPLGLDYTVAEAVMRMDGRSPERQRELFRDLRLMEAAALAAWAERREQRAVAADKARH
jgi:hypothetical protein